MDRKRRATLVGIADAILGAALATSAARSALAAETARLLSRTLPELNDPARPSFDVFYALSQLVTCRSRLDRKAAEKLYPLFMEEPWGPKHIATAYEGLTKALTKAPGACSAPELIASGALGKGETWFCTHLLITWYLGIYYHERKTVRVLYEDALMQDPVRNLTTIPGLTGGEPGYWIKPPAAARGIRK
ncbi:MAG: hypothetical protein HYV99_03530 [Betaproteobacteria bacterium]|nr:hypothetical protein [Betaproteobacteria bacterium]